MLCTSGFVDDVMFSHNDPVARLCIPKRRWNTTGATGRIPTKFCSTIKTGSTHCELLTVVKFVIYDLLVYGEVGHVHCEVKRTPVR